MCKGVKSSTTTLFKVSSISIQASRWNHQNLYYSNILTNKTNNEKVYDWLICWCHIQAFNNSIKLKLQFQHTWESDGTTGPDTTLHTTWVKSVSDGADTLHLISHDCERPSSIYITRITYNIPNFSIWSMIILKNTADMIQHTTLAVAKELCISCTKRGKQLTFFMHSLNL